MKKAKLFKRKTSSSGVKKFQKRSVSAAPYKTKDWTVFRFRFLHHNPKCYSCNQKSQVVDHCVAHKGDMDLFWCETNFIPLCHACHNTVTALFDRHTPPKTAAKMEWIESKRIETNNKTRVRIVKPDLKEK